MKALSVLTAMVLAVYTSALAETKASVVLVHGAFADGSSWNKVITRLPPRSVLSPGLMGMWCWSVTPGAGR